MPGPWTDYQKASKNKEVEIEAGPWTEYSTTTEPIDPYTGLKKSATSSLPAIGSAIGGLITAPTVGGSVLGSAAGRGLGSLAQKAIEHFTEEQPQPIEEAAFDVGKQTLQGVGEGLLGAGIANTIGATGKGIGKAYTKIASSAAKVPEETLEYYAKNSKQISKIAEQIGKDPEQYADAMRAGFDKKIGSFMNQQNKSIETALETAPPVKVQPVIEALEKAKAKIKTRAFPEAAKSIDDEILRLRDLGEEIPAAEMNAFKQRFQNLTNYSPTETYRAVQPQLNTAFKDAARIARKSVNDVAPEVAKANNNLARLHDVKEVLNKNLIKEGAPSGALTQAGIGRNPRALKNLERLSKITGEDFVTPTTEFGIASQMNKAGLLGDIPTGIGLAPLAMGQAALPGPAGLLAAAAASPMGTKYILPAGYKYGPKALGLLQRGSKSLVPAGSYLLENE